MTCECLADPILAEWSVIKKVSQKSNLSPYLSHTTKNNASENG